MWKKFIYLSCQNCFSKDFGKYFRNKFILFRFVLFLFFLVKNKLILLKWYPSLLSYFLGTQLLDLKSVLVGEHYWGGDVWDWSYGFMGHALIPYVHCLLKQRGAPISIYFGKNQVQLRMHWGCLNAIVHSIWYLDV